MNNVIRYLWSYRKVLLTDLGLFILLAITFYLYDLPRDVVFLILIMWSFLLLVIGILNYIFFKKRMNILRELDEENIPSTDLMPGDSIEKEYGRLLNELYERKRAASEKEEIKYTDTVDYFTIWAHQIKTPIAALSLITENMDDDDTRSSVQSELTDIEDYVDMVLNYLRLDSELNDLVFDQVDIDKVIKDVIRKFKTQFIMKGIGIRFEPKGMKVGTDEKWIRFILGQLMSNALKYSNGGTITITTEGNIVTIEDQGIGISAEDLPRVFEKGYTGHTGRRFEKSTGIGLFLVKNACDMIGADIRLESEKGVGTKAILKFGKDKTDVRD